MIGKINFLPITSYRLPVTTMPTFHTNGLVLRVTNHGENDKRARIYTPKHGKLEVFVKSARKIESKLSPHLEPMSLADCYIVRGRVDHLAGIERYDRFYGLRDSLEKLAAACWATELVDNLTKFDHPDSRIFSLLHNWYSFLEISPTERVPDRLRLSFLIALLEYLGYGLESGNCVKCKTSEQKDWFLAVRDGGIICGNCPYETEGAVVIDEAERQMIASMKNYEFKCFNLSSYRVFKEKTAKEIIFFLVAEHLDKPLVAEHFLSRLETMKEAIV